MCVTWKSSRTALQNVFLLCLSCQSTKKTIKKQKMILDMPEKSVAGKAASDVKRFIRSGSWVRKCAQEFLIVLKTSRFPHVSSIWELKCCYFISIMKSRRSCFDEWDLPCDYSALDLRWLIKAKEKHLETAENAAAC